MKRKIGLAMATGLALLVAGCASQSTTGGGSAAPAQPAAVTSTARNFNLAVKCPGVHWEKTHGWSNEQIMQQESLDEDDIPACEQWVQAQPKGYVPPPPGGAVAAKAPAPGAPPAPTPQ
jgi:hypothetical protein